MVFRDDALPCRSRIGPCTCLMQPGRQQSVSPLASCLPW